MLLLLLRLPLLLLGFVLHVVVCAALPSALLYATAVLRLGSARCLRPRRVGRLMPGKGGSRRLLWGCRLRWQLNILVKNQLAATATRHENTHTHWYAHTDADTDTGGRQCDAISIYIKNVCLYLLLYINCPHRWGSSSDCLSCCSSWRFFFLCCFLRYVRLLLVLLLLALLCCVVLFKNKFERSSDAYAVR